MYDINFPHRNVVVSIFKNNGVMYESVQGY